MSEGILHSRDHHQAVTIAVMGATGSGKTTMVNLASGSHLPVGLGLLARTTDVQAASPFVLDDKIVTLIDTPGFDHSSKTEAEILTLLSDFLAHTYEQGRTLNGILYLHRISDSRIGGTARSNLHLFRQLCGDASLHNVCFVTNFWGDVVPETGAAREQTLRTEKFFKPALDCGARLFRHDNTANSVQNILRQLMTTSADPLLVQREMVVEKKIIIETTVGKQLISDLEAKQRQLEIKIQDLKQTVEAMNPVHSDIGQRASYLWQNSAALVRLDKIQEELELLRRRAEEGERNHMATIRELVQGMVAQEVQMQQQMNPRDESQFSVPGADLGCLPMEKTERKGLWRRLIGMLSSRRE